VIYERPLSMELMELFNKKIKNIEYSLSSSLNCGSIAVCQAQSPVPRVYIYMRDVCPLDCFGVLDFI
jgi:hypothetical protein